MQQEQKNHSLPSEVAPLIDISKAEQRIQSLKALHARIIEVLESSDMMSNFQAVSVAGGLETNFARYILNPSFKPEFLQAMPQRIISLDIETTNGENREPVFALAVTIDEAGKVLRWEKGQEAELIDFLTSFGLILTYNGTRFDFSVLSASQETDKAQQLMNKWLDIALLVDVITPSKSKPLRLWTVAMNTLLKYLPKLPWAGPRTSGAEQIPEILERGEPNSVELIWRHCFDDVAMTRELYAFLNPSSLTLTYYYQKLLESAFTVVERSNYYNPRGLSWREFEIVDFDTDPWVEATPLEKEKPKFPYDSFEHLLREFSLYEADPQQYPISADESFRSTLVPAPGLSWREYEDDVASPFGTEEKFD